MFGEDAVAAPYPELVAFCHRFRSLPRIGSYLASPARLEGARAETEGSPYAINAPAAC